MYTKILNTTINKQSDIHITYICWIDRKHTGLSAVINAQIQHGWLFATNRSIMAFLGLRDIVIASTIGTELTAGFGRIELVQLPSVSISDARDSVGSREASANTIAIEARGQARTLRAHVASIAWTDGVEERGEI